MSQTLEENAKRAQQGDQLAVEELVARIQGKVYGLALRTLWHPEDARDATQEILLRVVTHLVTFRGESRFSSWVYRIAANHLLRFRESRVEKQGFTFETFGKDLKKVWLTLPPIPTIRFCFKRSVWAARWGCSCAWIVRTASPIFWGKFWKLTATKQHEFWRSTRLPSASVWKGRERRSLSSCKHDAAWPIPRTLADAIEGWREPSR